MPTYAPLLIDLAGIARLAEVRRPVASVWRTRFAGASDPFPQVAHQTGGRAFFNAMEVAQWLERTEHGNNPDAVADAAASAAPLDFDGADPSHVAAVDALLTLRAASGTPVGGAPADELRRRAAVADPDDLCLVTEVSASRASWTEWADLLADAAYSPAEASTLLERRHGSTTSSAGSSGPLSADAEDLLVALTRALMVDRRGEIVAGIGVTPSFVSAVLARVGDDVDVVVSSQAEGRSIRRRLLCEGIAMPTQGSVSPAPKLHVQRVPSHGARSTREMLRSLDELVLGMRDDDRAVFVAPAGVLMEALAPADSLARTDVLRSGRVRAIVKLPAGLVSAAPRESLALWVLGRETADIPVAERFTAVADLTEATFSRAARADLTSDVLSAMGSALEVLGHAFRFARLVRTTSLLASRGALVPNEGRSAIATRSAHELPALLDQAVADLGDAPLHTVTASPGAGAAPARVEDLIADRHLRRFPGTRMSADEFSDSGLVVVGADDLDDPARIGGRRVDPMDFAAKHPSARLTVAGDVIFRTAPSPKAWVDPDGSKVVIYPARLLRIDPADPGGLVPEVIAADIDEARGGPATWRRWRLRRVTPGAAQPLRSALSDLAARRAALERRVNALDSYARLLTDGVVSGAVTLTEPAADAASEN